MIMATVFNRQAGGHNFAFGNDICTKCGMTLTQFENDGEPACESKPPEKRERMFIDDDQDRFAPMPNAKRGMPCT